MDLNRWVKVFDRILPRSRAWGLILDRVLRKLFHGLSILPKTFYEHVGSVLLEAFPQTTTYLEDWSWQFGSPTTLDADGVDTEWGDPGGQTPQYIQDLLHANGFPNLFVHEWWDPGLSTPPAPPVSRNPIALVPSSFVLVNDLSHSEKHFLHQFGDGESEFVGDASVQFGAYDGYFLVGKEYPTPDILRDYPFYYYICGPTWPNFAIVIDTEFRRLLRLIYKTKPVHLRCILRVRREPASIYEDIQDTTWETSEIQDAISAPDDIQDHI